MTPSPVKSLSNEGPDKGLKPLVVKACLSDFGMKRQRFGSAANGALLRSIWQGNRIKVNGKVGGWSPPLGTKLVVYTTIWTAAGRRNVIPAAGTAHFVAYATIFEVAFQIQ
jgi:hypothetical protein